MLGNQPRGASGDTNDSAQFGVRESIWPRRQLVAGWQNEAKFSCLFSGGFRLAPEPPTMLTVLTLIPRLSFRPAALSA
jgi:hypothetical protein